MGYHKAFCPQCGIQIVIQNHLGAWNCFKPTFTQADLIFADGHRCRTVICKDCVKKPDVEKIFHEITVHGSTAAPIEVLEELKKRGVPVNIVECGEA